jgi:hypothetical protein
MNRIAALIEAITARWYALPQPVRSGVVDAAETGIGAALAVQVVMPSDVHGFAQLGTTLFAAFGSAFVSALRRQAQAAINARRAKAEAKLDAATAAEHPV